MPAISPSLVRLNCEAVPLLHAAGFPVNVDSGGKDREPNPQCSWH